MSKIKKKLVILLLENFQGPIAQFGRALEWHSRGQEFDPPWVHKELFIINFEF